MTSRVRTTAFVLLATVLAACGGHSPGPAPAAVGDDQPGRAGGWEAQGRTGGRDAHRDAAHAEAVAEADAAVADATRADAELVIWADDSRAAALAALARSFGADRGVTVAVQQLPLEQIRDQLLVTGPQGRGPDVVVGPHDWLGELVPAGSVAPVDFGGRGAFADVAVQALVHEGRTYGVPHALRSVALVRNTRHAPQAPRSWEELAATALGLQARDTVAQGLALPADPYHLYPLVTAFGGYLFGFEPGWGHDASDLGIDSPGGAEAARRLRGWVADGLIDPVASSADARELFAAGQAAFAVLEPAVGRDRHGLAAVPHEVTPLPPVDGRVGSPFVTVDALMVSANANDRALAERFVTGHAATRQAQSALAAAAGRPPAHLGATDDVADPDLAAFAAAAGAGVPLPAIPETGAVWGPWDEALAAVLRDGRDPVSALARAGDEIRALIGPSSR